MGAKIGVLLNCGQQSQFSKVRREFDAGRVNLDPPMTCADWPVPGNLTVLHAQTVTPGPGAGLLEGWVFWRGGGGGGVGCTAGGGWVLDGCACWSQWRGGGSSMLASVDIDRPAASSMTFATK